MGKQADNPKIHIISCRVSNKEKVNLQELAKFSNCNLSTLLRTSLGLRDAELSTAFEVTRGTRLMPELKKLKPKRASTTAAI